VTGDTARIAETRDAWPNVTFRCDVETYVLMRYGRLLLADALATGRVVVEGDKTLVAAFGQWFKAI
jgi:putative sterol carrier protein